MNGVPTTKASRRLWSLDVFRGLCSLTVFVSHWILWADFTPVGRVERFVAAFLANGVDLFRSLAWNTGGLHPAVIGFFVLSGFCIHAAHCGPATSTPVDWPGYFRNRANRILPVYWWASLLGLGFVAVQTHSPAQDPLLAFHATGTPLDFALRLTGLGCLYPRELLAGNATINTVASELVVYACYPLFLACARKGAWRTMGILSLLIQFVIIQLTPRFNPYWIYNSPLMMAAFWYSGALAARWYFSAPRRMPLWPCAVCWLAFIAIRELTAFHARNLLLQLLWCGVCVWGLLWLACLELRQPSLGGHRAVRALRRVGIVSYSLYAVHTPIMMIVTWTMIKALPFGQNYGLQLLFSLTASVAMTIATYHFIERRYFRSKVIAPKPPGPGSLTPVSTGDTAAHTARANTAAGISA